MTLTIRKLDVYYGKAQALHQVNLNVSQGEFVAVIGPNGAGKTTLFNAISGFVPYRGQIEFEGCALPRRADQVVRRGIIHCPEGRNLFPYLSVRDNLRLGGYRRQASDAEIAGDLEAVYQLFPVLKERAHQVARTLSGGEQQMLAIGRALVGRPRLLLLDEPTLGLAPIVRANISEALRAIQKRYQMTILLAEQNAVFAFEHSQRIYLLETGRVVREGTAAELKADAYIRQSYLGG
jgi:branched-chain amino acid transport system ATP-binding protein